MGRCIIRLPKFISDC